MPIEFSDPEDILILSAALQVFDATSPEFGHDALDEHPEMMTDDVIKAIGSRVADLINKVNDEARVLIGEAQSAHDLPLAVRPVAVWCGHTLAGAVAFSRMVEGALEQMSRRFTAENN